MQLPARALLLALCLRQSSAAAGANESAAARGRSTEQEGLAGANRSEAHTSESRLESLKGEVLSVVAEIDGLRDGFEHNMSKDAVERHVHEFAQRAKGSIDERRDELVLQFKGNVSAVEQAAAAARNATGAADVALYRREVAEGLSNMRSLDEELREAESKHVRTVRRDADGLSSMARRQARRVESQGEHLARLARRRVDRLDDEAWRERKDSGEADKLDLQTERAMRALQDAAEEGARRVDDHVRNLVGSVADDLEAKVSSHQESRHEMLVAMTTALLATPEPGAASPIFTLNAGVGALGALLVSLALALGAARGRRGPLQETLLA